MSEKRVVEIPRDATKRFILGMHYARRMPCVSWAFGLFRENVLIGVVTYGKPASPFLCVGIAGKDNADRVIELNRLCIDSENRKNLASFLVGRSLQMLPGGLIVVSYSDAAWGHAGYVYQAANFTYTGTTSERTDMAAEDGAHSRHNKGDSAQRQLRSAKHRYHFITGNRRQKKEISQQIQYKAYPYPKIESKRYDVNNPAPSDSRFSRTVCGGLFA